MEYKLNAGIWGSVFAVPSEIIDKSLKILGAEELKILLWILRNNEKKITVKIVANEVGCTENMAIGALKYWESYGIISLAETKNDHELEFAKEVSESAIVSEPKKQGFRYQRPSSHYICQRMKSSEDIGFLMQEAEVILRRPLSTGDSGMLLMLHDNDGLPVDVILMILQYAMSVGKPAMKYIEKIGISWAKEGIDDLSKAEKKIQELDKINLAWKNFEKIIEIEHRAPTSKEEEVVARWFCDWNFSSSMVKEAYERCVNANGKYVLNYIDSIIRRWHSEGITTIEQAKMENVKRKKLKNKSITNASYNIDEYENYNIFDHM